MLLRISTLFALVALVRSGGYSYGALPYAAPYAAPYASPYAASPYSAHGLVTPAITSQQANTLRTYGNLGQISTFSKTIDTPFSTVRKADVRVSNPGTRIAYGAPAYGLASHSLGLAPALGYAPRPLGLAAPAVASHGLLGVAYSAAPAVAHMTYSNALGLNYAW